MNWICVWILLLKIEIQWVRQTIKCFFCFACDCQIKILFKMKIESNKHDNSTTANHKTPHRKVNTSSIVCYLFWINMFVLCCAEWSCPFIMSSIFMVIYFRLLLLLLFDHKIGMNCVRCKWENQSRQLYNIMGKMHYHGTVKEKRHTVYCWQTHAHSVV